MLLSTTTKQLNTSLLKPISNSVFTGLNISKIQYKSLHLNTNLPTTNIINKRYHNTEAADELTAPKQGFSTEKDTSSYNYRKKEKKEKKRSGFLSGGKNDFIVKIRYYCEFLDIQC
ncbi:hypothetical protein PIROE2DRAFT_13864 [Piromyces sp. E2]|nr:hypothetical protein PIROE2DRAFT_13864 [Piromyces sp. E2]|eukprot:OUM60393.1 hypothetical protein PIROE2DRAFT_13864 [Piromyces sp. E2]